MPARERPYVLPGLIEDAPIFRATIELDSPPRRVQALNPTTVFKRHEAQIEITVSDVHEVVLLGY